MKSLKLKALATAIILGMSAVAVQSAAVAGEKAMSCKEEAKKAGIKDKKEKKAFIKKCEDDRKASKSGK